MKLAQKMMLIPAGRTPLELSTMSELDQSMSNVVNNKHLSTLEKLSIYSQILKKNLKMEEKLKENNTPSKVSEESKKGETKDITDIKDENSDDELNNMVLVSPVKKERKKNYSKKPNKINKKVKNSEMTPDNRNMKWDSLSFAPRNTRRNTSKLDYSHLYPKDTYDFVGYSPEKTIIDTDGKAFPKRNKKIKIK